MASKFALPTYALTARERDCLRLLGEGLSTAEVAADLGIRRSTLESHLAAARRKLGVATTRQAVLAQGAVLDCRHASRSYPSFECSFIATPLDADVASGMQGCISMAQAWQQLVTLAEAFGAVETTCGLIAEPPGRLTNGGRMLRSSFVPTECSAPVADQDDMARNPVGAYAAACTEGRFFGSSDFLRSMAGNPNPQFRSIALAYLERSLPLHYCQPGRDQGTSAPYIFFYSIDKRAGVSSKAGRQEVGRALSVLGHQFWSVVQDRRWLVDASGLTSAQTSALQLLARGFLISEAAEHLGLSTRGYEKLLAGTRATLGARTNAQAIYSAMVFRAL